MKHYLDTSVVVSDLLEGSGYLQDLPKLQDVGSSRLLEIEMARVLERLSRTGALSYEAAVRAKRSLPFGLWIVR